MRYSVGRLLDTELHKMSAMFYKRTELSEEDFHHIDDVLMQTNPSKSVEHLYILHHLRTLIAHDNKHFNLTNKERESFSISNILIEGVK